MAKLVLYSKTKALINSDATKRINRRLMVMIDAKEPKVGYIASEHDPDQVFFKKALEFYDDLGIRSVRCFDLEQDYRVENEEWLFKSDIIHLPSGNTYTFLKNLRERGLLEKLKRYSDEGGIIVGVSAGVHILAREINCARFGDENHARIKDFTSLGLVDFEMIPHWNRKEGFADEIKAYSKASGKTIYTVEDGEGIVIDGEQLLLYGHVGIIEDGKCRIR